MATINLGSIKFNWKGAYNGATAYAVDDVVSSGGNSYVCIQASTGNAVGNATAYWNIMSSAGTNGTDGSDGTDLSTTLTTQSDILYRDGSGLQRLPKGTAGQTLAINSGATAPEWVDASGGGLFASGSNKNVEKVKFSTGFSTSSTTYVDTGMQLQTAQLTTATDFIIHFTEARKEQSWNQTSGRHMYSIDGGSNWLNLNQTMVEYETSNYTEAYQYMTQSGTYYISFTSGQTPWFKVQARVYGGSNSYFMNSGGSGDWSSIIATKVTP